MATSGTSTTSNGRMGELTVSFDVAASIMVFGIDTVDAGLCGYQFTRAMDRNTPPWSFLLMTQHYAMLQRNLLLHTA